MSVIYLGIVTQAKGSSYLETAGTKVICGVYGPRESQRKQEFKSEGKLTCEINYAPFSRYERHRSVPSSQDKEYSNLVIQALEAAVCLETFPKAQVDIYINVLQDDGNVLASSIICASVALANAGIEMFDLVSACSLVYDDQNFVIDASCDEINTPHSHGTMIVGYLPSMNLISCLVQDGDMEADRSIAATKACIEGSIRIYAIMQESLVKSVKKRTEQRYI